MTKSMYNAFRCAFVIEVDYLLSNSSVFQEIIPTWAGSKRIRRIILDSSIRCFDLSIGIYYRCLQLSKLSLKSDHQSIWGICGGYLGVGGHLAKHQRTTNQSSNDEFSKQHD
jgi:hypothetical protein